VKLQKLSEDFVATAERYGRVIISEYDPSIYKHSQKELDENLSLKREVESRLSRLTIKPDGSMGGFAGGVKFRHGGILFKFALDWVCPVKYIFFCDFHSI